MKTQNNPNEPRFEGGWDSKMAFAMKKLGYNQDVDFELATVTNAPPELRIRVDNVKIEFEKDDLIVAEHLTKHKRYITIRKSTDSKWNTHMRFKSGNVTESMSTEGYLPHTHDITMLNLDNVQEDFDFVEAEMEFNDELKVGDRIVVASINNGQSYIILDRMVVYK